MDIRIERSALVGIRGRFRGRRGQQIYTTIAEVRALLQERQARRKAELDASRQDSPWRFAVGDEMLLLDNGHTPP